MRLFSFILFLHIAVGSLYAQGLCIKDSLNLLETEIKYTHTINSVSEMRKEEARWDSIWRKEGIWNMGVAKITKNSVEDLAIIEPPKWASWNNLEKYFVAKMKYPPDLLQKNQSGYSVAMFSIDTLGLPRSINILTSIHKDFDKEVVRLIKELPHCLPCRDESGKRIECWYTVYVPFLPQQYRDRVKADSINEENLKHCFVEWEEQARFQDRNPSTVANYIYKRLSYDPKLLGEVKQARGIYTIRINSYGEVTESKTLRSCGIQTWDEQVEQIIMKMPRWIPAINHYGNGEYRKAYWGIRILFKNED